MAAPMRRLSVVVIAMMWATGCGMHGGRVAGAPEQKAASAEFNFGDYEGIPLTSGRVFRIDSRSSQVLFFLWRGGPLASEGHNHVLSVKRMDGAVFMPADMLKDEFRFDIVFHAADIEVDPLPLRAAIGGAFSTGLTEHDIRNTRQHMLGEKVLDARRFPTISLSAARVYGELPKLVGDTVITLHGIRGHRLIPMTVTVAGDRLDAEGSFAIEQTDFGIKPFSAAGGALYLQNPIMVQFRIVARTG